MKKLLDPMFAILAVMILIMITSEKFFELPPVAKMLDPFIGLVQNENEISIESNRSLVFEGVFENTTKVYFDDRKVPHIQAASTKDLYVAQGYMVAYFRLWQMEFIALKASGRIAEKVSESYVEHDRLQRRLGIGTAAEQSLSVLESDPHTKMVMDAFTEGVNTYIENLSIDDLPIEYKLLDYKPEKWNNLKTALVMKYLMSVLSGFESDQSNTAEMLTLGTDEFNRLFPSKRKHVAPMVTYPNGKTNSLFDSIPKPEYLTHAFLKKSSKIIPSGFNSNIGSNSWAVTKSKSYNGNSILASDPHLNLSIPSIWLEMQLEGPVTNVYGVTLPGIPGVLIGFNSELAWGITNGSVDTKDWYKLQINGKYESYFYSGQWHELNSRVDTIRVKNAESKLDTIYSSLHGPIVYDNTFSDGSNMVLDHALSWELHKPSDDLSPFLRLGMSNAGNYKAAIKSYKGSALNFIIATKTQDISGFHQGKIPVKWPGQGMFLMDGSDASHLYERYIPNDSLPMIKNPESDYVFSANQTPTDYTYPYYYTGYFVERRALRIKELLDSIPQFDTQKMMDTQIDNKSYIASYALPILLACVDTAKLKEIEGEYFRKLKLWKGTFDYDSESAGFYYLWMERIRKYTWDELSNYEPRLSWPQDFVLLDLVRQDPSNKYFDIVDTQSIEEADEIIFNSFVQTVEEMEVVKKSESVQWGDHNPVHLTHPLDINQFEFRNLKTAGYSNTINAISSSWGPSWRMVVEMDSVPHAFGIYPGGQSGNPLSKYYSNSVNDWKQGKYYKLKYYTTEQEAQDNSTNNWILN